MSWFDEDAGRPLLTVLQEGFRSAVFGAVTIVGREGGGQVFFAGREVVFATCDGQVPLRSELELSGAATHAELGELARTTSLPLDGRGPIPPAVAAVVRDHSEAALAELQALRVGSARVDAGETPPFGVLLSMPLAQLADGAALVQVRSRAAALRAAGLRTGSLRTGSQRTGSQRTGSQHTGSRRDPQPAVAPGADDLAARLEPAAHPVRTPTTLAPSTRASALRRLIGAVRTG